MLQTTASHIRVASFMNCGCKLQGLDFHTSFQMDVWPAWIRCGCRISRIFKSLQVCPTDFRCPQQFFTRLVFCPCSPLTTFQHFPRSSNIFQHLPTFSHIFQHLPTFQQNVLLASWWWSSTACSGGKEIFVLSLRCLHPARQDYEGIQKYTKVIQGMSWLQRERCLHWVLRVSWLGPWLLEFNLRPFTRATAIWVRDFRSLRVPQHWLDFLDPWTFVDSEQETQGPVFVKAVWTWSYLKLLWGYSEASWSLLELLWSFLKRPAQADFRGFPSLFNEVFWRWWVALMAPFAAPPAPPLAACRHGFSLYLDGAKTVHNTEWLVND